MSRGIRTIFWSIMLVTLNAQAGRAELGALTEGQVLARFRTEAVYEDAAGQRMGARFRHAPTGFVVDLLYIQSVPQAFMWVNSFPPSNQGEPHTCEHLLLGKGTKGRYVASLEDMSLGSSSAFTMQIQTCYHYHTSAGTETFFDLMEAKLDALLHPNFSDEEIHREVANIGYRIDPRDSSIHLEEKGTVYTEMVSSFERPWGNLGRELDLLLYGPGHPLSNNSGGYPDDIRTMTPDDLRRFHRESYRLGNMGMVVSVPPELGLEDFLRQTSEILGRVQPEEELDSNPTAFESKMPPAAPAEPGAVRIVHFPHRNVNEPGLLVFAWPAAFDLSNRDLFLLELLFDNLARGQTSDLYRMFIDSKTRQVDLGASAIFNWISSDLGHPIYVGFSSTRREAMTQSMIDSVRSLILARLVEIGRWAPDSPEMKEFNTRIENRMIEGRRALQKFLNSPPGFGFRGTGAWWFETTKHLQNEGGFRRRLTRDGEFEYAQRLLEAGGNPWSEFIDRVGLLDTRPYAVAATPDPQMLEAGEKARQERIAQFTDNLLAQYGVEDADEARRRYRMDYDRRTDEIDAEARNIPMPGFVDNPPLGLDDQLDYRADRLNDVPLLTSTFENITSGTVGLARNLDVVPARELVYVPAQPTLVEDVGVIRQGKPVSYDEMKLAIQKEILSFDTYYSVNHRTGRAELVIRVSGSDTLETKRAIDWLATAFFSPDWRPENLDRIRDAVDLALKNRRNTMRYSEEAWVQESQRAYEHQDDPVLLSADCFLTQVHALHRLRWLLKEEPPPSEREGFNAFLSTLAGAVNSRSRGELLSLLEAMSSETAAGIPADLNPAQFSGASRALAENVVSDLRQSLSDIPDASLAADWSYLCRQMAADLAVSPGTVLEEVSDLRNRLAHRDNARMFQIASTATQKAISTDLANIADRLSSDASSKHRPTSAPLVLSRLAERTGSSKRPVFVGLVNENTRAGVFVNTAPCSNYEETDPDRLIYFLSARLYGGGGAHSMFMKTWGAGLAYSNGLRSDERTGRMIYYAERCPDLAQTMQFVTDELMNAPHDTTLAEYAIAQAFAVYRTARRYEERGEAMAADLADGLDPEVVRRFRRGVLALRDRQGLYDELHARMPAVYGQVLPGYGTKVAQVPGAVQFIIGPEAQFRSFEDYLRSTEDPDATVARLYPRDFWQVRAF